MTRTTAKTLRKAVDAMAHVGTIREVLGNRPLALGDSDAAWCVREGRVDVFAVPANATNGRVARTYLFSVRSGGLLFGDPAVFAQPLALVAVALPGTNVIELTRDQLAVVLQHGEYTPVVAHFVDQWCQSLVRCAVTDRVPQDVIWLRSHEATPLVGRQVVSAYRHALWLTGEQMAACFVGDPALKLADGAGDRLPLVAPAWLECSAPATITAVPTDEVVGSAPFWSGLSQLHRLVMTVVAARVSARAESERGRFARREIADEEISRESLQLMAAVVQQEQVVDQFAISRDDPLLAACQVIGQFLAVKVASPNGYQTRGLRDPLTAIARNSGLRVRRVLLPTTWWTQDLGPLVAFRTADNSPVALIPATASSYREVDPCASKVSTVSRDIADTYQPWGYAFYRGFRAERLHPRKVLKFGMLGTWRDWLTTLSLGLAGGLLGMLIPVATGVVFGRIVPGREHLQLLLVVLGLLVAALVQAMFQFTQGIAVNRLETRMGTSVEAAVWDRLLNLPAAFFRQYAAGDLAMRAAGINLIRRTLTDAAMTSVVSFAFSSVSFVLLFYYDPRLALVAAILFALVVSVTGYAVYRQMKHQRAYYDVSGKTAGVVLQLLSGIPRLRVAGAEERAIAYWARRYSHQTSLSYRRQAVANKLAAFSDAVPILSTSAIFATVAVLSTTSISVGNFLAFTAAFTQIIAAAGMLSVAIGSIMEVVPLYERAKPILTTVPERRGARQSDLKLTGDIEISHVSFGYQADGPLVLDDVSLRVRPGEFVALVGPSGAGKSTVLRMLLGFESPTTGSIYFDREDITGLDLQSIRRQMGVILQTSQLTSGDILSNITRSYEYTQEEAWEAARMTGLDQDIQEMPMGMYTAVSDGEATLSGGQRQRLLITRAIVSKPNVILFDEATSALDNVSQAKVAESLERLKATRIVVAHRLSTIVHADRICVMERGKLVQEGTYEELISVAGPFSELAKRQL